MPRIPFTALLFAVGISSGCGEATQDVIKPENPAPPPGVEAVETMGYAPGPPADKQSDRSADEGEN